MQVLAIYAIVVAVLAGDVQGKQQCHPFSCGHLQNISYPFHWRGDPYNCGVPSYELDCSSSEATIRINTGTYYVTSINYTTSTFWVVDASLKDANSSCPLPRSDQLPYVQGGIQGSHGSWDLVLDQQARLASFVNCSQAMRNNSMYIPIDCLSTSSSFVYVFVEMSQMGGYPVIEKLKSCPFIENLKTSCGYLAMIPLGGPYTQFPDNASFADVIRFMRNGFAVQFPLPGHTWSRIGMIKDCLKGSIRGFHEEPLSNQTIKDQIVDILFIDFSFWSCIIRGVGRNKYYADMPQYMMEILHGKIEFYGGFIVQFALFGLKWIAVVCRFVIAPLTILVFLSYEYWKTRITINAVDKFLRMQLMLGPTRYAYTDIIAMTNHFGEKLGQGGFGSVYKGVILPRDVYVAVKMLSYKCDGEEFINEVATIGRIHHINVVCLVGFCSEKMRRALVYEYMPRGSLDKYIFSSERSFSWDKLNKIALGIAKGINYLHQGCDMQILHFDIKPHNILLDDNFVPKVADFGLAKLYLRDKSFVSERALRGTVGYIAPEMVSRSFGVISSKSDVYSFGTLLLEMAGGRKNADPNASQTYYPSWVYDQLIINRDQQVEVSEISSGSAADMHELERKLCLVGLWCIQMKPHDRPTMSEAIEMPEGDVDALQVPPRPFFCDGDGMPSVMDSYFHSSELTVISEEDSGITELESS